MCAHSLCCSHSKLSLRLSCVAGYRAFPQHAVIQWHGDAPTTKENAFVSFTRFVLPYPSFRVFAPFVLTQHEGRHNHGELGCDIWLTRCVSVYMCVREEGVRTCVSCNNNNNSIVQLALCGARRPLLCVRLSVWACVLLLIVVPRNGCMWWMTRSLW